MFALIIVLMQTPAPIPPTVWPTVAEGWTARNEQSTIHAAYRMFTAPEMGEICGRAPSPARLVAKGSVVLRVGQWFDFSSLRIVAVDSSNHPLPPVPVMLELEEIYPPLFDLRNDIISDGGVTSTRAGRFTFRARTICAGTSAQVVVPAVVLNH